MRGRGGKVAPFSLRGEGVRGRGKKVAFFDLRGEGRDGKLGGSAC